MLRFSTGFLAFLVTATLSAQDFRNSFTSVTPTNFDEGGPISRQFHLNAESYLRMASILKAAPTRDLPTSLSHAISNLEISHAGERSPFVDYVGQDPLLDGVVILHHGEIVFEAYPNMNPRQRHFAWSVTKVVVATALVVLAESGQVEMDAPIERYVPSLSETEWEGTSVSDIANMASGISCLDSDGYQDQSTCVYTMEESLGITAPTGRNPDFIRHLQSMERHRDAGTKYEYVSANTNVLMLVIEAVTGEPVADTLQKLIWDPIGPEAGALIAISEGGYVYASGGLHARLRDIARFGQIYSQPKWSGVLTQSVVRDIQEGGIELPFAGLEKLEERFGQDLPVRASMQWDLVWPDGAMIKGGYLGQGLYVDPARSLVIAWFGTGLDYSAKMTEMLPVARQISRSGLLDTQRH